MKHLIFTLLTFILFTFSCESLEISNLIVEDVYKSPSSNYRLIENADSFIFEYDFNTNILFDLTDPNFNYVKQFMMFVEWNYNNNIGFLIDNCVLETETLYRGPEGGNNPLGSSRYTLIHTFKQDDIISDTIQFKMFVLTNSLSSDHLEIITFKLENNILIDISSLIKE